MLQVDRAKYIEQGQKMRKIPQEESVPSHEWEELVQKMCASDDTGLQVIGNKELCELKCRHR